MDLKVHLICPVPSRNSGLFPSSNILEVKQVPFVPTTLIAESVYVCASSRHMRPPLQDPLLGETG